MQIRQGKSNRRNPTLTDHAVTILPYRGIGTGIPRVLEEWPETRLFDDVDGNEFRAVIPRPVNDQATAQVTAQVTEQVTAQVTAQVGELLARVNGEMTRQAIQDALGLAHRENFRKVYLAPALELGVIEMTLPNKPRSSNQRYRLTALGRQWLKTHSPGGSP